MRGFTVAAGRALGGFRWPAHNCPAEVGGILRLLADDGWHPGVARGNHRALRHASKSGRVTGADEPSDELARSALTVSKASRFRELRTIMRDAMVIEGAGPGFPA
jgi:predicted RNA binding protein YcfA (HicA-like mRNA interferase family)